MFIPFLLIKRYDIFIFLMSYMSIRYKLVILPLIKGYFTISIRIKRYQCEKLELFCYYILTVRFQNEP